MARRPLLFESDAAARKMLRFAERYTGSSESESVVFFGSLRLWLCVSLLCSEN